MTNYKKKFIKYLIKYKKLLGGSNINNISIIENNTSETEFAQKEAYINFGIGELSTYNLVNCIAVGGIFDCYGKQGSFLTHESPTDYTDLFYKLIQIQKILNETDCTINNIILFRINEPGRDIYDDGLTVEKIIDIVIDWLRTNFKIEPQIELYYCSDFMCGKAIISPNNISTTLQYIKMKQEKEQQTVEGTFRPIVLKNKYGDKVYQCPKCQCITGTGAVDYPNDLSYLSHSFNCENKNKLGIEE